MISGETIRQTALERSETCPKAMKGSFYYGFREGAKWMQNENPLLKDVADHKAIIVDTNWLKNHDKEMIWKACKWLSQNLQYQDPAHYNYDMNKMYAEFVEDFKQAMEN